MSKREREAMKNRARLWCAGVGERAAFAVEMLAAFAGREVDRERRRVRREANGIDRELLNLRRVTMQHCYRCERPASCTAPDGKPACAAHRGCKA